MANLKDLLVNGRSKFLDMLSTPSVHLASKESVDSSNGCIMIFDSSENCVKFDFKTV